ncbi:MAG: DedA family protein [Candidatus Aenigmarchaeota archaeon]|nr:DedA family protein [Candidatus Aenigmarchaeota archaeon]
MDIVTALLQFILHIDGQLVSITQAYGLLTYAILFAVIFLETGLVVAPFLPGDSLLFAAGALAALGSLDAALLFVLLAAAAILGDTVNYWIGHRWGTKLFTRERWFLKKESLDRASAFYERHGGKVIVMARFIPIIRTFAPFVAGLGKMRYRYFLFYNVAGGLLWTGIFVFGGFYFGSLPAVKDNFSLVIFAIIAISLVPVAAGFVLRKRKNISTGGK